MTVIKITTAHSQNDSNNNSHTLKMTVIITTTATLKMTVIITITAMLSK